MSTTTSIGFSQSFRAEWIKVKNTPLLWLCLIGGVFIAGLFFLAYIIGAIEPSPSPEDNPWVRFTLICTLGVGVVLVPFVVLTMGAITYYEHQSQAWKYLYSLPMTRGKVYFAKLALALLLVLLTYIIFILSLWLSGFLLGVLGYDPDFLSFRPDFGQWLKFIGHSYISLLGIIAIQYWFSLRWSNIIIPIGLGILAYILTVLVTNTTDKAIYFPYSFPMMISIWLTNPDEVPKGLEVWGSLTNVQWFSMISFVVFTLLGWWDESRKEIR